MNRPIRFLVIPILLLFLLAGCEHGSAGSTTTSSGETEALTTAATSEEEREHTSEPSSTEVETETVASETEETAVSASTEAMTEETMPPETTITPETEPTEPPSPPSEQPTQPATQPPTEPPTEPPTQPKPTEPKPTEPKPTEHVHSWSDWTQTAAPTCSADGWQTRVCTGCGFSETRNIPATGNHSWQETAPTCTQEGAKTCKVCGKKETVPALGHDWVHSDEVGHWQNLITCRCGAQFSSTDDWYAHATASPDLDYADAHAGYELHQIWVVDTPARDVCSRCGTVK